MKLAELLFKRPFSSERPCFSNQMHCKAFRKTLGNRITNLGNCGFHLAQERCRDDVFCVELPWVPRQEAYGIFQLDYCRIYLRQTELARESKANQRPMTLMSLSFLPHCTVHILLYIDSFTSWKVRVRAVCS